MRVFLVLILFLMLGFVLMVPSMTYQASYAFSTYTMGAYTIDQAAPPVSARAWGVFDAGTGKLLFGRNADTARPIASVTKLMTAEVALATMNLEATTTLSERAVATEGWAGSLAAGDTMTIRELLFPLMLSSSNDAAEAIAEGAGRNVFLEEMNQTAAGLGMESTHYDDPSGLSPKSVSSAEDLAKLLAHLMRERPYLVSITGLSKYIGEEHTWKNINPASSVSTFEGGKHGFTDEAGKTLAAIFDEPLANGETKAIAIVLLDSDDLKADVAALRAFLNTHVAYR